MLREVPLKMLEGEFHEKVVLHEDRLLLVYDDDEPRFAVLSVGFEFRLGTVFMAEKLALKGSVLSSEDELVLRSMNLSFWSAQMTSQTF